MKITPIILFYFVIVTFVFSQSPKYDLVVLMNSGNIQVDSTNGRIEIGKISGLINSRRLDRILTSSMQWGGVAIIVGGILESAFNQDAYFKYLMTASGGVIASAIGFGYGMFSTIHRNYNVGKNIFGSRLMWDKQWLKAHIDILQILE